MKPIQCGTNWTEVIFELLSKLSVIWSVYIDPLMWPDDLPFTHLYTVHTKQKISSDAFYYINTFVAQWKSYRNLSFQHFSSFVNVLCVFFVFRSVHLIGLHNGKSKCFSDLPMNIDEVPLDPFNLRTLKNIFRLDSKRKV